ncbi:TolC family protein [Psychroflexus sp. CAK57W]|uniref:TolC family protein n=1 Tax=Psychroflexus curvus TaxID=2873595 RepID=UPI001CCA47E7|nr:TolC family protein [Psychroflexus curvus]MBZ9627229.1 TolC family protein [Psychroflexus curvus]MBZ9787223.1 TolC family protein [Psychroflexus curvus]
MIRFYLLVLCLFFSMLSFAQEQPESIDENVLGLNEFLAYVKEYHPIAQLANFEISSAQAELLKSRGAFDPQVMVDWKNKEFKGSEYYDILNSTFKIPTWYGIEVKAGFEQNQGEYLNPQNTVPNDGLYSAGISVPVGQGLFINQRMADVRQAKIMQDLSLAQRDIRLNQLLSDAVLAYLDWYLASREVSLFSDFVGRAEIRFEGIKQSALAGDIPTIDTLEAGIIVQNRKLSLEQSNLKLIKSRLQLSNFLWFEDNIPLELNPFVVPEDLNENSIDPVLGTNLLQLENFVLEEHPKIKALDFKIDRLEVERRLKAEMLKPQLDLEYNFINERVGQFENFNTNDYKAGLFFKLPLFLRKERGNLKLAKIKVNEAQLDLDYESLQLQNKIQASRSEILSYQRQLTTFQSIVTDYASLLRGEERKFSFGESSVFLLNSREVSLIDSRLKEIKVFEKLLKSKVQLFNVLVNEVSVD